MCVSDHLNWCRWLLSTKNTEKCALDFSLVWFLWLNVRITAITLTQSVLVNQIKNSGSYAVAWIHPLTLEEEIITHTVPQKHTQARWAPEDTLLIALSCLSLCLTHVLTGKKKHTMLCALTTIKSKDLKCTLHPIRMDLEWTKQDIWKCQPRLQSINRYIEKVINGIIHN